MKALLDAHTLLWVASDDPRLSPRAYSAIMDPATDLMLSAATAWEIAIKLQASKLRLPSDASTFIQEQMSLLRLTELPIRINHALEVGRLPMHHRDPFDRLLVAQAIVEKLPILSADPQIARYGVEIIW